MKRSFNFAQVHPPRRGWHAGSCQVARAQRSFAREGRFFRLHLEGVDSLDDYLERHGDVPLPPYIARAARDADAERYQTVYARHAGRLRRRLPDLHFDDAMLAALARAGIEQAYVTLHVGAGTFQPVDSEDLTRHTMHASVTG
jgi:S-adenosylmethionine:tRNA ribosyltransferase-isomerase